MKQDIQNIVEGNKLIAEFMGAYTTDSKEWIETNKKLVHEYEYHSSWDWLMGVVGKIEEEMLAHAIWIEGQSCRIQLTEQHPDEGGKEIDCEAETKIQAVWQAVIQFIQWYNNQQKQVKE